MNQEDLQINELAQRAGVTVRTIRYYINEGLLPPPDTRGRYAVYSDDYVDRLKLIQRLKDAFLPLKEIRERVGGLSAEQVRDMLAELPPSGPEPDSVDAMQLPLEGVPHPPAVSQESLLKNLSVDKTNEPVLNYSTSEPETDEGLTSARDYLREILNTQTTSLTPRRRDRTGLPQETEDWQRIPLAPGVELHVRQPVSNYLRERMRRLLEYARTLFGPNHPGGIS